MVWDPGHPFRWRTWLRGRLPWPLINLGLPLRARIASESGGSTTGTTSTIELAAATTARSSARVNSGRGHETPAPAQRNLPSKLRHHRRSSAVATGFGYPKLAGDCGQGGADVERQRQTESPRGTREATSGCHAGRCYRALGSLGEDRARVG